MYKNLKQIHILPINMSIILFYLIGSNNEKLESNN